jgi:nitroreductase
MILRPKESTMRPVHASDQVLQLGPDELLSTTRTVRKRLDLDRPVPRAVVGRCLELAAQAPSGENSQPYRWIVVDDPDLRVEMARIYRAATVDFVAELRAAKAGEAPDPLVRLGMDVDLTDPAARRIGSSVAHLRDNLHRVPVLVVPVLTTRVERMSVFEHASTWGSVLPAVWSFMLALRSRGLGSAWTTAHLHREAQMADLLGIPFAETTQVGLFPVAYTVGTGFRPGRRGPIERITSWNGWRF